jgi:hypothetical protein
MQTERVTFLTSRDHKAALDAYAVKSGQSVGNVVREATVRFIAEPQGGEAEKEAELALLTTELEQALPSMRADIEAMTQSIREANEAIEAYRAEKNVALKAAA